jgi:predicted PurR-regulated permease PerM
LPAAHSTIVPYLHDHCVMFPLSALLPVLFVVTLMLLLRHFLGSLAWACLLAVITWPLHEKLLRRGWSPFGSAATLLGALLL